MSWQIQLTGLDFNSDDFLIEDLGAIEKATGESWAIANPLRDVAVARAFLAAALLRSGRATAEVEDTLTTLRLKHLRKAFTYVPDDEDGGEAEELDPSAPSPSRSSGSSSDGESPTASPPLSLASSG